jgi:MFS family permease
LIPLRTVICLGFAQLVSWGTTYYLIGVFGGHIAATTGWSRDFTYAGFSLGLLVMGFASPWAGRLVDRYGGRPVLAWGSLLNAVGCAGLAHAYHPLAYCLAWGVLGLSMRLTLYDAAFAGLALIGGAVARRSMAQITLFGGLASTTFWPLGNALINRLEWRGALLVYAAISLAVIPLHLCLPSSQRRYEHSDAMPAAVLPSPVKRDRIACWLYAAIMALVAFLNSAMSAHMIGILAGLGLGTSVAAWVASLRGIGQTTARACDVVFGTRLSPPALNLIAALLVVAAFIVIPISGMGMTQAILFALAFGAGNGLMSITRGTLPLVLLNPGHYGSVAGWLLAPSFALSAPAPVAMSLLMERWGVPAGGLLSLAAALCVSGLALVLRWRLSPKRRSRQRWR